MKILSPAGNFESLVSAIVNGADEVYLGINEFNARNNIDGFTIDTLTEAVDYAHLYGVKVNLAVNILFNDVELESAVKLVVCAYNLGVDAFIVQDLGLIKLLFENYPEIEIHASTQMGLHNLEGVKEVLKYGIKRVVLARETPLSEVKRIKDNLDVEIEYFIQGALCVSFSGNCYLSSYLFDASGNRGRCKQLCRLPYTLKKDGKFIKNGYLLSAKDFNMIDRLDDLRKAGVDVLKIEGRARRPFYVGAVTREYYNALHGKKVNKENIELAFNRTYTEGYFNGNGSIISDIQNHIGVKVGRVEKVVIGKKFNEVFISSRRNLSPKSTFKFFFDGKELSVITAFDIKSVGKDLYRVTTTQRGINEKCEVRLISDFEKEEKLSLLKRKIDVNIDIKAQLNEPITATVQVDGDSVTVSGEKLAEAVKQPLLESDIKENFSKSEYFNALITVIKLDRVFITKKSLNEFRRKVFDTIYKLITQRYKKNLAIKDFKIDATVNNFTDFIYVNHLEQIFDAENVIYSPETYDVSDVKKFYIKCRESGKNPYLDTPNFALEKDVKLLSDIVKDTGVGIVANNYYALGIAKNIVIGAGLNVYNKWTANSFSLPVISAESDEFKRIDFPYMTLRHCPMKEHLNAECKKCPFESGYTYITDDGRELKLTRKKLSTCTFYLE